MKKFMKAKIKWTPKKDGGKVRPIPVSMRYCPILVFDEGQTGNLWSGEIYNLEVKGYSSIAKVSFLREEAPFDLIQVGAKFCLYEGHRVMAQGVITGDMDSA
jgi:hypothetical protein